MQRTANCTSRAHTLEHRKLTALAIGYDLKEDASRIRKDHAPENLATIRRIAFGLVKTRLPQKMTVKRAQLRMKLNWDFALEHFFTKD